MSKGHHSHSPETIAKLRRASAARWERTKGEGTAITRLRRYLNGLGPDAHPSRAEAAKQVGVCRQRIDQICLEAPDVAARLPPRPKHRKCRICGAKHNSHGLCTKHLRRLQRHGDPLASIREREGVARCHDCGRSSRLAKAGGKPRYLNRVKCADGKIRCQKCAYKSDPEYRARHTEACRKSREKAMQDPTKRARLIVQRNAASRRHYDRHRRKSKLPKHQEHGKDNPSCLLPTSS